MKISIVDYEVGNIFNVVSAFEYLGVKAVLTRDPQEIRSSDKLLLPGVGAFEQGMSYLKKYNLDQEVKDFSKTGKPLLGICMGMQLLFEKSYEDGEWQGLGLIPGTVTKFPTSNSKDYKVPHMGWNKVEFRGKSVSGLEKKIGEDVKKDPFFYFAHSYFVETDAKNVLLSCHYADRDFAASVKCENILGYQFHPERSGEAGLRLLKTFIDA
jgi:glutamine amidotransferase